MNLKTLVIISLLVTLTACKSLVPTMDLNNNPVNAVSLDKVEKAIMAGSAARGWTPMKEKDGHIIASINVRGKHQAAVDIFYNDKEYSIKYKDSLGLKYEPSTGKIHPKYNQWVNNLKTSINTELYRF